VLLQLFTFLFIIHGFPYKEWGINASNCGEIRHFHSSPQQNVDKILAKNTICCKNVENIHQKPRNVD
jgi:hypothetical protein